MKESTSRSVKSAHHGYAAPGAERGRAMWGLPRTLVNNLVAGVTNGFTEKLEINGVGYRAAVQGKVLNLQLGFSHDVPYPIPDGIQIVTRKADRDRDHRAWTSSWWARSPRKSAASAAGALQGQGREICRRAYPPQGRQEEVTAMTTKALFERAQVARSRYRISQLAAGRPRLSVFRSGKHIYAQVIDDGRHQLAAASTAEKDDTATKTWNVEAAQDGGQDDRRTGDGKGRDAVVFDRGGYIYHGRVKALAEAAREGGLEF